MGDDPGRESKGESFMELILEQITKNFGTKQVLKGASYTFAKEGIYGLLGRNGAGKTACPPSTRRTVVR